MPEHLQSSAEVPLSKVPNPKILTLGPVMKCGLRQGKICLRPSCPPLSVTLKKTNTISQQTCSAHNDKDRRSSWISRDSAWLNGSQIRAVSAKMPLFLLSSSRSTKLTVDMGSVHSGNAAPPHRGQALSSSYSQMLAPSAHPAVDEAHDDTLTAADVGQYLELSPKPERCR